MTLKYSYTLIAPLYDLLIEKATIAPRKRSLKSLDHKGIDKVLIAGIGSGLDIPHLPTGIQYTGIDLTPAMIARAQSKIGHHDIVLQQGDVMSLPYDDNHFDAVVMHLILAVVPNPALALLEAERVVKPNGKIIIFDKFLKQGELAFFRRMLNILLRHIATRTDVVFEQQLKQCKYLKVIEDRPALAGGWFRQIRLQKIVP